MPLDKWNILCHTRGMTYEPINFDPHKQHYRRCHVCGLLKDNTRGVFKTHYMRNPETGRRERCLGSEEAVRPSIREVREWMRTPVK